MVGIKSCGAYIPRYRMARKTITSAMGWLSGGGLSGDKAVTNFDEDSLTMAVAAGMDCLSGADLKSIDGCYYATTTAAYRERESAAIIATALSLSAHTQTSDFGNSLKAGTGAAILAGAAIAAGVRNNILVCASDSRLGKPGSSQEMVFGDAAAALLMGNDNVIASLEGSYSLSYDFTDHYRTATDKFDRSLEDRWIRDEAYTKFIPEAVNGLFGKYKVGPKNFTKIIYPALYAREHAAIGKKLGFEPDQIQGSLLNIIGDSGTASPLLMLVAALEEAKPGDNLLVASHGSGSEALWFKVTPEIETRRRKWVTRLLNLKKELTSYEKYLVFSGILPVEIGIRAEIGTTLMPLAWRERKTILALSGSLCKKCGTPQYPPQRICVNPHCGAVDEMEEYRFAEKGGIIFSYTEDHLAATLNPPNIYGAVDFNGGGRATFDFTDCEAGSLEIGMPVKMTFRRKYIDEPRGIHQYGWKAIPVKE